MWKAIETAEAELAAKEGAEAPPSRTAASVRRARETRLTLEQAEAMAALQPGGGAPGSDAGDAASDKAASDASVAAPSQDAAAYLRARAAQQRASLAQREGVKR